MEAGHSELRQVFFLKKLYTTYMPYVFLAIAFTLNATANILLKIGALKGISYQGLSFGQILSNNAVAIIGLFFFALNAVFYFMALRSVPISVAYPVMVVMSLLLINGYAIFALKEQVSFTQLIGYALIIAGVVLVFMFKK
jgi:multidrug transporter EmrE-like cation transporter